MYCSRCATEIPNDANFCYKCSYPVTVGLNSQAAYNQQTEQSRKQPKKFLNTETPTAVGNFISSVIYIILAALLVMGVAAFLFKLSQH